MGESGGCIADTWCTLSADLKAFSCTDDSWPAYMRVNSILVSATAGKQCPCLDYCVAIGMGL
jgi:hypothetical protein